MIQVHPGRPRKSPRQARAAATYAALVEAAARILEAKGLKGFTTNAVARLAGVSIGSLYQYFPDKDAIMAALITRDAATFDQKLTEALDSATGLATVGVVSLLAKTVTDHQVARPGLSRILDLEEQRLGLSEAVEAAGARTLLAISKFLERRALGGAREAADIIGIARGLIDSALDRSDVGNLEERLSWAVLGYLALARQMRTIAPL